MTTASIFSKAFSSEVRDLVDPFRMVDEGVTVVLPISVDLFVPGFLSSINCIAGVPGAHVRLNPWVNVPLIVPRAIAARPISVISHREIEIGAR